MATVRKSESSTLPTSPRKRPASSFSSEETLASPVVLYLQKNGFEVWQEVSGIGSGAIYDIVAVKDGRIHILECKRSLGIKVLTQAYFAKDYAHAVHVVVPSPRITAKCDHRFVYRICKDYGIGLIYVSPPPSWTRFTKDFDLDFMVDQRISPKLFGDANDNLYEDQMTILKDYPKKFCNAGSSTGGYYTSYKETMLKVKKIIKDNPGITLSSILAELKGDHHYASESSARGSLRTALESFESDWCGVKMGHATHIYYYKNEV